MAFVRSHVRFFCLFASFFADSGMSDVAFISAGPSGGEAFFSSSLF